MASTVGLPSYFGQILANVDVPELRWKRPLLVVVCGGEADAVGRHLAAVHPLTLLKADALGTQMGVSTRVAEQAAVRVMMRLLREQKSVLLTGLLASDRLLQLARQNRGGFQMVYALDAEEKLPRRLVGKRPFVCHPDEGDLRHLLQSVHQTLRERLGNEAWWQNRYDRFLY